MLHQDKITGYLSHELGADGGVKEVACSSLASIFKRLFLARYLERREDLYILVDILHMTIRNRNHSGYCKWAECNKKKKIWKKKASGNSSSYLCSLPKLHGLYLSICLGSKRDKGWEKQPPKLPASLRSCRMQLWEFGCNNITFKRRICFLCTFTRYHGLGTFWKKKLKSHILCYVPKSEKMSWIYVKTLQYFSSFRAFFIQECWVMLM